MTRRVEVLLSSESNTRAVVGGVRGGPALMCTFSDFFLKSNTFVAYSLEKRLSKKLECIANIHRDEIS